MPELHPLLAARWSPRAFDPVVELTPEELSCLLEAGRWAPSADNSQPWRFLVGLRDDDVHKRIMVNLTEDDGRWAGNASALIVAGHVATGAGGTSLTHAAYDLGQAVAHLSVQAGALGLFVHQITRFDAESLRADLDLPADLALTAVVAVGRLGNPDHLPADLRARELALRTRRPAAELLVV